MKYTPAGAAVCTFGIATNRNWTTENGEKKEDVEFHNIVAWNKLAEICAQLLKKGRKVFVEGRLSTHSWQGQDGVQRSRTEVIISDMIILDKKGEESGDVDIPEPAVESDKIGVGSQEPSEEPKSGSKPKAKEEKAEEPVDEDIPF